MGREETIDWELWTTFGVIVGVLIILMLELVAADIALLGALGLVVLFGVLPLDQALAGFANPTLVALASLFVVATALRNTGVLSLAARSVLGGQPGGRWLMLRLVAPISIASAFLNNTPIVAMAIPAVQSWCQRHQVSPARLLMPVSYASIFGGMCTLMGTSTNLVSHGLLRSNDMPGLGFFELAWVGLPCTLAGWLYLIFVAPRLIPEHPVADGTSAPVADRNEAVVEIELTADADVVGRPIARTGLRQLPGLELVRLERGEEVHAPVEDEESLEQGDRLVYAPADATEEPVESDDRLRLAVAAIGPQQADPEASEEREAHTAVVRDDARIEGETIEASGLAERFNAAVEAVRREGDEVEGPVEDIRLQAGDTLVLSTGKGFREAFEDAEDFYVLSGYEADEETERMPGTRSERLRAALALAVLTGIVGLSAAGLLHIAVWALLGAVLLVVARVVPASRARDAVDWKVLLVIGAALGLGEAMQASGGADLLGSLVVDLARPTGPHGLLLALVLGTSLLTNVITNNGAVAIFFPIALTVGESAGIDPRPLVLGITAAGSMALATPLGYQTNLMVYSAGDYRFADFARVGLPLQLLLALVTTGAIAVVWSM